MIFLTTKFTKCCAKSTKVFLKCPYMPYMVQYKKLHYISGLTLSIFIGFHLLNHLFSLAGPEAHIELTERFRQVYRHPVAETVLLPAVLFQVITGVRLLFNKKKKIAAEKVQIYSGMYLSYFLTVHVAAVLYGRYIHLDTNFWYAAVGLNMYPATWYFIPYYFLSVAAISLHVASLHYLKTKSKGVSYAIAIVGIAASALIIVGFTDAFHWREAPEAYQNFMQGFMGK